MTILTLPALPPWWSRLFTELRIDVSLPQPNIEKELQAMHRRLNRRGSPLFELPELDLPHPRLRFRYRVADGEHYVYAEDPVHQRLAGYTVFNRLIELDRHADPHLRAPHSRYAQAYQRQGIATLIYRWWLDGGRNLITGVRQSAASHALWQSLGTHHPLLFVELHDKVLRLLGPQVDAAVQADFHTRMVLLGQGWTEDRFVACTRCRE